MRAALWRTAVLVLALAACGRTPAPQSPSSVASSAGSPPPARGTSSPLPSFDALAEQVDTLRVAGLRFTVPQGWIEEVPRSAMRLAQYRLPGESGPGELAVFSFGPGQGGDTQANIDRWLGQFADSDALSAAIKTATETLEQNGLQMIVVRALGTYHPAMMGPMAPPAAPQADYALFGLIVEGGPQGTVFLKATGPRATIEAQEKNLRALGLSARRSE